MVICQYCSKPAKRIKGKELFPQRPNLYQKWFFICYPCDAWAGANCVHYEPVLANAELRFWRNAAHYIFDQIWKDREMTRGKAYKWLAKQMGIHKDKCHMGLFNKEQCKEVIRLCKER